MGLCLGVRQAVCVDLDELAAQRCVACVGGVQGRVDGDVVEVHDISRVSQGDDPQASHVIADADRVREGDGRCVISRSVGDVFPVVEHEESER